MRVARLAAVLVTMSATPLAAQVAKPAGLRAGGAAKPAGDSASSASPAVPAAPTISMPAPTKPVLQPPKATEGPTARERAGLAKATRAMKQAPRGTPASSGRSKPPARD